MYPLLDYSGGNLDDLGRQGCPESTVGLCDHSLGLHDRQTSQTSASTPLDSPHVIHRPLSIGRSFRMINPTSPPGPIFHRIRDSIEAHLTIVDRSPLCNVNWSLFLACTAV
jgi:hypothetical protein